MPFGVHVLHLEVDIVEAFGESLLGSLDNGVRPGIAVFIGIEQKDVFSRLGAQGFLGSEKSEQKWQQKDGQEDSTSSRCKENGHMKKDLDVA
jgi:hypothetical protein